MTTILFWPEKFHRQYRRSPRLSIAAARVHLVFEFADFNTPWPKTRALMRCLQDWIDDGGEDDFAPLFTALADERVAADAQLPDTGVGLERERWLSSAFIRGEHYGTRASTVVAIGHDGGGVIVERRFGPNGHFEGETILRMAGLPFA